VLAEIVDILVTSGRTTCPAFARFSTMAHASALLRARRAAAHEATRAGIVINERLLGGRPPRLCSATAQREPDCAPGRAPPDAPRTFRFSSVQSDPLVTIITPTRDRDWPVVRRCLYSVRGQTYQNFEHLVCSDGVFEPYIQRPMAIAPDRRQRYYHSPTQRGHNGAGVCDYMMQFAEGEFVCFLTDHSVLLPDYVAHMTAALEDNPNAGFAVSRTLHLGRYRPRSARHRSS
jgi:hypothetical protein